MVQKFFPVCLCLILIVFGGCARKQVRTESVADKNASIEYVEEGQGKADKDDVLDKSETEKKVMVEATRIKQHDLQYSKLPQFHKVIEGECLWWIAGYRDIYKDPFMWPLIYKANRAKIENPDLIYPGQMFYIPRSFSLDRLKESRSAAGAPSPFVPAKDANLPPDLISELGWKLEAEAIIRHANIHQREDRGGKLSVVEFDIPEDG